LRRRCVSGPAHAAPLASDFRAIDPREARVVLIEAAPRLLTPFDPSLSEAAKTSLEKLGVEVRLAKSVTAADCSGVSLGDERLEARTIMWAAGVVASPAGQWLGAKTDRAGRVVVEPDLSIPSHPDVFVIGDAACALGANGKPLPGVAPVAKQQGAYVAAVIKARAKGQTRPLPLLEAAFALSAWHRAIWYIASSITVTAPPLSFTASAGASSLFLEYNKGRARTFRRSTTISTNYWYSWKAGRRRRRSRSRRPMILSISIRPGRRTNRSPLIISSTRATATLVFEGVDCTYEGFLSESYHGFMNCADKTSLPLRLWTK
jgi:hypothetical protein